VTTTASVGWIVQPALFDDLPRIDPTGPAAAETIVEADEQHVERAIAAGFDTVWVEDHMGWNEKSHLECISTLAWLAGRHPGSRWGTMVCGQAFRNPAYLAKVAANLQLLTGGQFILGLGAGNNGAEHREFGFRFGSPAERLDELEDAIRIMRALWLGGRQTLATRTYRIEDAVVAPRPEHAITIMVGGGGERRTLRLVAELGDWWCSDVGDVETFAHKSAVLDRHCHAVGRDPATVRRSQVAWIRFDATDAAVAPSGLHLVAGAADDITDELVRFRRAGVDHFQLRFMDFPSPAGFERFVDRVLPRLTDAWA
jgi:alkanesulfonate monooxygenase SsuD/methylene tetrahydromethanopterin reductase-like flavin-dependent oxidoreductase (luciferase family)